MIEFRGKQYDIATIDFETHYAKDYSLTSMPTSEYVRDKRFFTQMVGIKINDEPTKIYTDPVQILFVLKSIDWKKTLLLCHNTAFDGFILTQKYRIKPAGYLDTLSMARAVLGHSVSHRLDNVGKCLGLGGKEGADSLADAKGLRILPPDLLERMGAYCTRDVDLCHAIFWKMYDHFPDDELELVDLTIRMFTEPKFQIDEALVREELEEEIAGKMRAILRSGQTKKDLSSKDKFAAAIQAAGGKIPVKLSKSTGKYIPALAKTDQGMRDLLNHPNEAVRTLAQARLTIKSTIGETRAQRFLDAAVGKTMPVLLNYYGAHTGRWSGGNKCLIGTTQITVLRADEILFILLSGLRSTDLVWDGIEFVTHEGLLDQGPREVMTYGVLTGTHDHEVLCAETGSYCSLQEVAEKQWHLVHGATPSRVDAATEELPSS